MAKKRTKKEALERLASLPEPPRLPLGFPIPPVLRPAVLLPTILDRAGKAGARLLIRADPLNRLDDGGMTQEIINNPSVVMDDVGNIVELIQEGAELLSPGAFSAEKKPRKVTKKMKQQRKIQSTAFRNANAKCRKKNGEFKKGFDQSRMAKMAQKECTKERQRLGLCEKPKRGTRKGRS